MDKWLLYVLVASSQFTCNGAEQKKGFDTSLSHFGRPRLLVSYEIDTKAEKFLQGKWQCGEISSLRQD